MKKMILLILLCTGLPSTGSCNPEASYHGKPITHWIKMLGNKDPSFQKTAVKAIGGMGPEAQQAVPALITVLKDKNRDIRYEAAKALGNIGPGAKAAAPALIDVAGADPDISVRKEAATALRKMGVAALPVLITAVSDQNAHARFIVTRAIGNMGPSAEAAVPALIIALKDKDANVRFAAAEALGNIGPGAKEAIPSLTKALQDNDEDVRDEAEEALEKIRGK